MNGIEKITARIETEARQQAEEIKAKSAAECENLKASYEKTSQDEYWKRIRAGVKECEQRVQRLGSTAVMESKKSVLALKQEMVGLAFERARELICNLPEDKYVDFLARLANSAARTGEEQIILNQRDNKSVADKVVNSANAMLKAKGLPGNLSISDKTRSFCGGIILKDGDIEVNCTVETLTQMCRSDLSAQAADIMFN